MNTSVEVIPLTVPSIDRAGLDLLCATPELTRRSDRKTLGANGTVGLVDYALVRGV
jgi:hypothetical protein